MVIKLGRFGKFYACSNFPDCRNTKQITKEIGVTCPVCQQGQVIERKSKRNRLFYGCDRYPECEFTSWDKPVGRACPKCDHYLVEKKFVVVVNKLSVQMVTTKKTRLNKIKLLFSREWQLFL